MISGTRHWSGCSEWKLPTVEMDEINKIIGFLDFGWHRYAVRAKLMMF